MGRTEQIEAACKWAMKTANDDSHGYSNVVGDNMGQRGDYDCGGFVSAAYQAAGVLHTTFEPNERYGNPWSYGTVLEPAGFIQIPFSPAKVQRGDILIKDGHHTELALGNGRQVGAHSNYDGVRGDYGHRGEISEVPLSGYWDCIYRIKGWETFSGWKKTGDYWYYYKEDKIQTGWLKWKDHWYYLDPKTGKMQTGWKKISGRWYLLKDGDSGRMLTGWQKWNDHWYYLDPEFGKMQTGWLEYKDKWYYLRDGDSGRMVTGWKQIKNVWYYFNTKGVMQTGTVKINGKTYKFDKNGHWIK